MQAARRGEGAVCGSSPGHADVHADVLACAVVAGGLLSDLATVLRSMWQRMPPQV